jgi:hypothetical protein
VRELQTRHSGRGAVLVIAGADHGLEVGSEGADLSGSLRALAQVMRAIEAFVPS